MSKDYALADQMRRAARSTMANIAEGFDRSGPREFHKALSTSIGSCAELRSDLYILLDVGFAQQSEFDRLYQMATEVSRITNALRAAVHRSIQQQERDDTPK